jgi:hypothetical protein
MATALTPIAWQSLASATATVTFSSIASTYRDLRLVCTYQDSTSGFQDMIQFNGITTASYSYVAAAGSGTSATSGFNSGNFLVSSWQFGSSSTAQQILVLDILDYSATDKHKTVLGRFNQSATGTEMWAGRFANTSAISSIMLTAAGSSGNFNAGSTFALYGIAG